jgi:chemotaxis signal transduction protein
VIGKAMPVAPLATDNVPPGPAVTGGRSMTPTPNLRKAETDRMSDLAYEVPGEEAIQRLLEQPLSPEDLRDATERVARPLQPPEKQVLRLLAFQLHGQPLAVEARHVLKVARTARVHRIPHRSNAIIRGFCHLDGELLLCADLANLLELTASNSAGELFTAARPMFPRKQSGMGDSRTPVGRPGPLATRPSIKPPGADAIDRRRMIVLEDQGHSWAFEVDAVQGVTPVVPDSLRPPPLTVDASWGHFTAKITQLQDTQVAVLDLPRVLSGFQAALS